MASIPMNKLVGILIQHAATVAFACVCLSGSGYAATLVADSNTTNFETVIDTNALFAASKRGDRFVLPLRADRALALENERILPGSDGARTWVGRAREGTDESIAYITELGGHIYASVQTADSVFEIVGQPGLPVAIRDLAAMGYTRKLGPAQDYVIPAVLGPKVEPHTASADRQKVLPTPQVTIDLMVLYSAAFTARYGTGAGVTSRLNNLIAQANDSYVRSEVAITLRLVRAEQTAYTNSNDNGIALGAMSGFDPFSGSAVAVAPEFSGVAASRNTYAADLVLLIRPFDDATHGGCGLAFVGGFGQTTLLSDYGYATFSEGADIGSSGFLCLDKSFQHELGHNMGLMHDRANSPAGQTGATSYGFGYIIPGTVNPSVGDIMSYADASVNCFSSPAVFRQGPASGLFGGTCNVTPTIGDVLGVATSNPTSSADAATALNFTRVAVSNFRTATTVSISGTVSNGASPLVGVTFCARPAAGVACTASNGSGTYSCTVPNGWTGLLHAPGTVGLRIKPQSFSNVAANLSGQNPVVQAIGACNLDVDNNGLIEPATDGVAILRRMLGANSAGFSGLSGTCAANTTSAAIFNATTSNYNATGGSLTRPGTDGLVILRAMQGLTGTAVTNGLGLPSESGATNTTWSTIRTNFLNATCGADFLP